MKAVSYLRCSGESQVMGDTWDRQSEAILKYASTHDVEIVQEFREEGVTGKMELEGRAALSSCLRYIQDHAITLVIVESSDRLARDMIVAEVIIREFQKIGVKVISASGNIDLTEGDDTNPTAKLIRQILAAVAEFERCVIVLKLKGARDRIRAEKGRCDGRHPFGMKPGEQTVLDRMRYMRDVEDMHYEEIAVVLNSEDILTRYGKKWKGSTIQKILCRPTLKSA